jgi:hypothetical protein
VQFGRKLLGELSWPTLVLSDAGLVEPGYGVVEEAVFFRVIPRQSWIWGICQQQNDRMEDWGSDCEQLWELASGYVMSIAPDRAAGFNAGFGAD